MVSPQEFKQNDMTFYWGFYENMEPTRKSTTQPHPLGHQVEVWTLKTTENMYLNLSPPLEERWFNLQDFKFIFIFKQSQQLRLSLIVKVPTSINFCTHQNPKPTIKLVQPYNFSNKQLNSHRNIYNKKKNTTFERKRKKKITPTS